MSTRNNKRGLQAATMPEAELLQNILDRLDASPWDLFIIGDGSGSDWHRPCGWASVLVDRQTRGRKLFFGGFSAGSVNTAESMPYLQALNWFDANYGRQRIRNTGPLHVHILTDSQVIASWGARAMLPEETDLPRSNLVFWAAIRELRRVGYQCRFHWAPRSTTRLNLVADLIAGLCRKEIQQCYQAWPADVEDALDCSLACRAAAAVGKIQLADPCSGEPISLHHIDPDA